MMSAHRPWGVRYEMPGVSPFVFDIRAIGAFRVLLAGTILWDQLIRLGDWQAFHSATAILSLADSRSWDSPWLWSLYWLSEGPLLPYLLEALRGLATLTLLFGIRSRLSAFVLFALLASVAARNPILLQGGDKVLVVMTFFACFLPLGAAFSLERLWFGGSHGRTCRSAGTAAYAVQVLLVWFMAGILKTGEEWWDSGSAISMALHLEAVVSEFARLWRSWDALLQPLTLLVFWLECLGPLLVLAPNYWLRLAGLLGLAALEVGIWLSLEVGLFPLISLVSLVPLIPARCVDALAGWRARRDRHPASELVLFYDQDCRFCLFACRLLVAVCGVRGTVTREAQSDPRAARILEESFAWSVATAGGGAPTNPSSESHGDDYRQGWDAVRFLVAHSKRPWLVKLLPGTSLGNRLYAWIGRHREQIGWAGRMTFGARAPSRIGEAERFLASSAITVVLAWNLASYPSLRDRLDFRPIVDPLISTFNLKQYWTMFAPRPWVSDIWHAMPALSRTGDQVDLLSGLALNLTPPRDGPDRYGGYRWRKIIDRSLRRDEIGRVGDYQCRTGNWSAMDIWEFSRPNLGNAATSRQPYQIERLGRWVCDGTDSSAAARFQAEIDATMAAYRLEAEIHAGDIDGTHTIHQRSDRLLARTRREQQSR